MSKGRIQVLIKPDASIEIEGHDFKGAECEQATSFLEKALGLLSGKRKRKGERWLNRRAGYGSVQTGR